MTFDFLIYSKCAAYQDKWKEMVLFMDICSDLLLFHCRDIFVRPSQFKASLTDPDKNGLGETSNRIVFF